MRLNKEYKRKRTLLKKRKNLWLKKISPPRRERIVKMIRLKQKKVQKRER